MVLSGPMQHPTIENHGQLDTSYSRIPDYKIWLEDHLS
jgi:hypothetical protein